jgi:YidC/Oxa1 family membrane protein insertase
MEERRLLLAFSLSLLVLMAYRLLVAPAPRPEAEPPKSPAPAASSAAPMTPVPSPAATPAAPAPPAAVPTVADTEERRVEVHGPTLDLALTNRGARVFSWRLPQFKDSEGGPFEMVQAVAGGPRPLDLDTGDPALDARLASALFKASDEELRLTPGKPGRLTFEYAEKDLVVTKRLEFEPTGYLVKVRVDLAVGGKPRPVNVLWAPGVGKPTAAETEVRGYQPPEGVFLPASGAVERIPASRLKGARSLADFRWAGVESTYFAAIFVPTAEPASSEIRPVSLPSSEPGKTRESPAALIALTPAAPEALLFVGPKDYRLLKGLGYDLVQVVPVGEWLGPLVVPLMALLRWLHLHIGNYGWSIVALTLLINVAMSPLRHYSFANGQKMAKLAPEMKVIQDRYRGMSALDKRREQMQREINELYARHGMSMGTQMAVGCLPMLLTLPFLFAIYRVLQISIELRGAPFLWIGDLSQKDPLFITPIIMGASMFLMQKMTPTAAVDPAQQRVMMMMPVILVGTFLWAPAGLNLYWLSSNLCSIVQQGITQRILKAEDRRSKKKEGRRK